MPAVSKRNKVKSPKKASPIKKEKKFISQSLQNQKPGASLHKKKTPKHRRRGVLYIKHLPHGFYEEELRGYFSQFGLITRLRLARSPKTLGSKGYAFIEFRYPEVAEIAADAMNNYIMFKNIIKTRFIPPNDIRHDYFRSAVKKVKKDGVKVLTSTLIEAREAVVTNTNKLMTTKDEEKRTDVIASKVQKQKRKLTALGIDYDLDEVAKNMGEAFMDSVEKKKQKTIENLKLDSDDEADDTFDPSALDVDSDDDFEDFEYDSEHTDDEDGIDVNIDSEQLENAIKIARNASKTAVVELKPKATGNKSKQTKTDEPEVSAKKKKESIKGKENKVDEESSVQKNIKKKQVPVGCMVPKRSLKKKEVDENPSSPLEVTTKRTVKKTQKVSKPTEKPASKEKKEKKVNKEPVVTTLSKPTRTKKIPAKFANAASESDLPPLKGKKAAKRTSPEKNSSSVKKPVAPQESPVPAKTKKLAKASGIEKKKPVKADKKLKLAAAVAVLSDASEIVKVVKGKEIKGKKKVGAKK